MPKPETRSRGSATERRHDAQAGAKDPEQPGQTPLPHGRVLRPNKGLELGLREGCMRVRVDHSGDAVCHDEQFWSGWFHPKAHLS